MKICDGFLRIFLVQIDFILSIVQLEPSNLDPIFIS